MDWWIGGKALMHDARCVRAKILEAWYRWSLGRRIAWTRNLGCVMKRPPLPGPLPRRRRGRNMETLWPKFGFPAASIPLLRRLGRGSIRRGGGARRLWFPNIGNG